MWKYWWKKELPIMYQSGFWEETNGTLGGVWLTYNNLLVSDNKVTNTENVLIKEHCSEVWADPSTCSHSKHLDLLSSQFPKFI